MMNPNDSLIGNRVDSEAGGNKNMDSLKEI